MSRIMPAASAQPPVDQPLPPMSAARRGSVRALLVAEAAGDVTGLPRSGAVRRRPGRLLVAGATGLTAAVVLAVVLVAADPAAPPSFASWTAVPLSAPPPTASRGELKEWASRCTDLGVGAVSVEGLGRRRAEAARREVLVDRRGDFTFCVDISPGSGTARDPLVALSGLRGPDGLTMMGTTVSDRPFTRPGAGSVLILGGETALRPEDMDPDPDIRSLRAYQLYGLVGADVTAVTAVLRNGLRVRATLHEGLWGLWWPMDRGEPTGVMLEVRARGVTVTAPATGLMVPG